MQLGQLLQEKGIVSAEHLAEALAVQESMGGHLGQILIKLGHLSEDRLLEVLSEQMQIPTFDLKGFVPDPEVVDLLPRELLERVNAVPLRKEMGVLVVGITDPYDFSGIDELRMRYGGSVETVLVGFSSARDVLRKHFGPPKGEPEGKSPDLRNLERKARETDRLQEEVVERLVREPALMKALLMLLDRKGLIRPDEIESLVRRIQAQGETD